jgi:hypothetical protein
MIALYKKDGVRPAQLHVSVIDFHYDGKNQGLPAVFSAFAALSGAHFGAGTMNVFTDCPVSAPVT